MKAHKLIVIYLMLLQVSACKPKNVPTVNKSTFVLSDKMLASTKTEKATVQPLQNELNLYGKITADNNKLIEVYPVVGGSVTHVYVELGDYVEKGKLLATIRSIEVAGFEKDYEDAQNDVLVAKNNLKVSKELFDGKLAAERDVIEAKSQLDKAQSQLQRISETYKIYNIKGGAIFEVRSPISGFVIQKNINEGMLLRNDKSDNIFDIAQIDEVWALANVSESDINQVKLGVDATVNTISYPDTKFIGKVDKIYNVIDQDTKAMKVRIKLANKSYLLKPEMRATIVLRYTEDKQMIAIPAKAIVFENNKNYVVIFKDRNNIETRQVEVYRQVGGTTFIANGLKPGEQVITENQLLIYESLNG